MFNPTRMAAQAAGACALALAMMAPAQAAPMLEMTATSTSTGIDLTVNARDFTDLYGYQFTLEFDPALVSAVGGSEGTFLANAGPTSFGAGDIDNMVGSISFAYGFMNGAVSGANGSGSLATYSFSVLQPGLANFRLSDVLMLDSTTAVLTVDVRNLVTAVPEPATLGMFAFGLFALLGARALKAKAR